MNDNNSSTMSEERDSPDVATQEATLTPAKKSSSKTLIAKHDFAAIKAKQDHAISYILPAAKNHPKIYYSVVEAIKKANLRQSWSTTPIIKDFLTWCRISPSENRPELVEFLTVLAVHDTFEKSGTKLIEQVRERNLREWADKQLRVPPQSSSATKSTPQQFFQRALNIKAEQREMGDDGMDKLQRGTYHHAGIKRHAPSHSKEPPYKRAIPSIEQEPLNNQSGDFTKFQLQPQRIILQNTGTQTDETSSFGDVVAVMKEATKTMDERTRVLEDRMKALEDHLRLVASHQAMPNNNLQQQMMEMAPLRPVNRAPPSLYFDPGLGSGGNGPTLRFG